MRVWSEPRVADLSGYQAHADWFRQAARISRRLSATAYSAQCPPALGVDAGLKLTVDGQFDETAAIGLIDADLDENDFSLYGAISDGAGDWAEYTLEVSRDAITELLASMPISGSLVYRAICPPRDGHTATP